MSASLADGSGFSDLLSPKGAGQKIVLFGGKGGVGKTTSAAAAAVQLADAGFRTLVVSTDPAHSLGDALGQDIMYAKGAAEETGELSAAPVAVSGCANLWALEVDASGAVREFRDALKKIDLNDMAEKLGIDPSTLESLGLEDLVRLLDSPPPGIDELVGIANVLQLASDTRRNKGGKLGDLHFDRIVIDTAPTGHTLRLLAAPTFLDGFLAKVMAVKRRIDSMIQSMQAMMALFSSDPEAARKKPASLSDAISLEKVDELRQRLVTLQNLLHDQGRTEFAVVTIPTRMAMSESSRLVASLQNEGIPVKHMIVNRVLGEHTEAAYVRALAAEQKTSIDELRRESKEKGIQIAQVPFFDTEVVGFNLKYLSDAAFDSAANRGKWEELLAGPSAERRIVIMGGKGGVGKTSSSAALALKFAQKGFKTLIVSTDPAHSLGDSLQKDLTPPSSQPVEEKEAPVRIDSPGSDMRALVEAGEAGGQGELHALEIQAERAIRRFRKRVERERWEEAMRQAEAAGQPPPSSLPSSPMMELTDLLETAPPGTDELVSLTEVFGLINHNVPGRPFERVVIDTAPTGHTLRLLAFPEFLGEFLDKLQRVRTQLGGFGSLLGLGGGSGSSLQSEQLKPARDELKELQSKMAALDDLLHDPSQSEFVVVAIPSRLAVAESLRLIESLKDGGLLVRRLILNQVLGLTLGEDGDGAGDGETAEEVDEEDAVEMAEAFVEAVAEEQSERIQEAVQLAGAHDIRILKVPYLDGALQGPQGLRRVAAELFGQKEGGEEKEGKQEKGRGAPAAVGSA
uniref:ArsA/GET3 Anion-transporting ATPase-like domain-containing protein n=1 Tax=Chromera velia CCMP2878 TaxID=1169474 RepID=A0A0G4GDI4_9ALVE|eukprot:Cvel_4523.t1-p1 / transcript=Cvel_4523.t1 / gene=Cvel_4523 / organism=Chromera_velia_CCMP2878 / gene_product=Putative arsenical pump-driving ATPase, putative / transcript_product=Putative arsenical pump-driving ATPase, putative / location=Cvel_scaffold198:26838-34362(-) / protein_length=797 / sequence_SO=supercontig / SO=protein_coding / is_pseudo=false